MQAVSEKYRISKTIAGVLIALGVTLPEVIITMISFQHHGVKMIEFALACNFGAAAYNYTIIPAMAYLLNFGVISKRPPQPTDVKFQVENQRYQDGLILNSCFFVLSCIAYYFQLSNSSISLWGAILQLCIFVSYIVIVVLLDAYHTKMIKAKLGEANIVEVLSGTGSCPDKDDDDDSTLLEPQEIKE